MGGIAEAQAAASRAAGRLDVLGDEPIALRLDAPYYLGFAEYFAERYEAAIRHLRRGIAVSRASGQGQFATPMAIGLAHAYEVTGRPRVVWTRRRRRSKRLGCQATARFCVGR